VSRIHVETLAIDGSVAASILNGISAALMQSGMPVSRHVGSVCAQLVVRNEGEEPLMLMDPDAIEEVREKYVHAE